MESKKAVLAWCRDNSVVTAWGWIGGALLAPEGHRPPEGLTQGWVASAHDEDGRLRGYGYGEDRDAARRDLMERMKVHGPIP